MNAVEVASDRAVEPLTLFLLVDQITLGSTQLKSMSIGFELNLGNGKKFGHEKIERS